MFQSYKTAFDDGSIFIEVYKNCLPHVLFKVLIEVK